MQRSGVRSPRRPPISHFCRINEEYSTTVLPVLGLFALKSPWSPFEKQRRMVSSIDVPIAAKIMTVNFLKRLFFLMAASVIWQGGLVAGPILKLSYILPPGVTCDTTLSSGSASQTLAIDFCSGPGSVSLMGNPFVTATAQPFSVSVDGTPGSVCFDSPACSLAIGASSEFDGSITALGGSGTAWIDFDVRSFGANLFNGEFAMPGMGIDYQIGSFAQLRHYTIAATFGDALTYRLSVQHLDLGPQAPDLMIAGIGMYNIQVLDATGTVIPGATISDASVPEPGTFGLFGIAAALLALGRRKLVRG